MNSTIEAAVIINMKVLGKVPNSIAYKNANSINPEINQAPSHVRPIVIK